MIALRAFAALLSYPAEEMRRALPDIADAIRSEPLIPLRERDGILAGLYMLDMMVKLNRKPSELLELLFSKVGAHYYHRIDTPFKGERQEKIDSILSANPETIGGLKVTELVTIDGYQFLLEDGGWLLIRFSGTEPIIRVYCETKHEDKVDAILQGGLKIAGIK